MNLTIDIGNTAIKIGAFENNELKKVITDVVYDKIPSLVQHYSPDKVIVSSVNHDAVKLSKQFQIDTLILDSNTPLPITIAYKTPKTLGRDRIAAVVGAQELYPSTNCLVIDIGTCITYEVLDANSIYHGGGISPGIDMKFKALHTFTANLPLVERSGDTGLIGGTTEDSIRSGVIHGTVAEIEEIIRMYKDKFSPLRIIMCGGGAEFIETKLKTSIEVHPELVLIGLNGIINHNA